MLGKVFAVLTLIGVGYGAVHGSLGAVSNGAIAGATQAIEVTISLVGMLALWNGVLAVLREAGVVRRLARALRPLLRLLFVQATDAGAQEDLAAALSANLLGLGNAATPLALRAMARMQETNPTPHTATDDMVTFTVLATAAPNLFPTTLIALRTAAGSATPFAPMVPIWIASFVGATVAVLVARIPTILRRPLRGGVYARHL